MSKAKLNQLCQKRSWSLPEYQTNREGPLHNPHFTSTVTINGLQFHSPEPTRTAKEAQNIAAKLAFDHFSQSLDMLRVIKNQLQNYAQKRKLDLPVYSPELEGPTHALRFKCKVTVDGQTFESPKFFSTLKDADQAAAEVALMSLSPGGVQEDQNGVYKNLLQELVQREGFRLPSYNTNIYCGAHMPMFVSQVEIEGEIFTGQEAKSKKQTEMKAAKVAYMALKERKEKFAEKKRSSSTGNTNGCTENSSFSNVQFAPSLSESTDVVSDNSNMPSDEVSTRSRRKKVTVYSRNTNVEIEVGGTLMPISDDK